ncbi:hypothetical protein Q9S36_32795 [Microbacterium sp. ARD31]|uniref:hypothetical protein n=1 Tax=Microbacterium sp. ARD31 TaxID=2962576 RepID=UPI0028813F2C|nr:hypothetical protein [Microbacterium sp. ARD31]MDT0184974.1 hypothetical protein [Microbacterium sp. ARD31]
MTEHAARWAALLLVCALGLAGCSENERRGGAPTPAAASPQPRCFAAMPEDARTRELTFESAAGGVAAIAFPVDGATTAMVLLHQTGGLGACGWGRFATAAQQAGVSSLAVDQCGYGLSTCSDDADQAGVVEAAVERARVDLGADRVVLVGASMGGHRAVAAVAAGVEVDAWADVSGPDAWDDRRLTDLRWPRRYDDRALVVFGADEPPHELAAARRLAARTGARLVVRPEGHGYELLTTYTGRLLPAGRELLRFVDPSAGRS